MSVTILAIIYFAGIWFGCNTLCTVTMTVLFFRDRKVAESVVYQHPPITRWTIYGMTTATYKLLEKLF
ncbi:hypothetical protein CHLORIS_89 [Vibrio phage Chloris]|nr:hypothetical protein CHLORIS_89 [Vibrio phage Chloris]